MNYKLSIWSRGIKLRWGGSAKRKKIPQTFWPPVNCLSMASIEWTDTGRSYSPDYQGLLSSLIMRHCVLHTFVPLTVQAMYELLYSVFTIIKCRAYYVQIYFKLIKWAPSNSVFIVKKKSQIIKRPGSGPHFLIWKILAFYNTGVLDLLWRWIAVFEFIHYPYFKK